VYLGVQLVQQLVNVAQHGLVVGQKNGVEIGDDAGPGGGGGRCAVYQAGRAAQLHVEVVACTCSNKKLAAIVWIEPKIAIKRECHTRHNS
jgi:hypothetical protein